MSGCMKPISTLMQPLRSVDLATMARRARRHRAQRRVRRSGRRGRRRSDGGDRARRRAAREVRRRFGDRDAATPSRRPSAASPPVPGARSRSARCLTMMRPILRYGAPVLHDRAPVDDVTSDDPAAHRRHDRDNARRAGHRPGGAAGRRAAAVFVIDLSVGRAGDDLIALINPEFVERDGMQLEEEGCLSVPGFNATVAAAGRVVVRGARSRRRRPDGRGHGAAGARAPARDGSSRRRAVRRSAPRHQARA